MWPVDYYITVGGGISSMDDRVILSEEYVSRGSLNLSYVKEVDGRLGLYLLSFIIPGWEAEPVSDYQIDEESMEDLDTRGKLNLLESNSTATKLTYTLAEKEINQIIINTRQVLEKAIAKGGTTIRSYTSVDGVHGLFQQELYVHNQENHPCKKCNTPILKIKVGGRGTYYCPNCQK